MSGISDTFSIIGASWEVFKKDKEVIFFSLLSGFYSVICLMTSCYFLLEFRTAGTELIQKSPYVYIMMNIAHLFLTVFAVSLIVQFFNAATVASAYKRMTGGDPTVSSGLSAAFKRFPSLILWAMAVSIFKLIASFSRRSNFHLRFFGSAIQIVASFASFFVVPVIMIENKNPMQAFDRSADLIGKTWGKQLTAHLSFGLILFVVQIPGIILIVMGVQNITEKTFSLVHLGFGGFYLIFCAVLFNTIKEIFRTALYLYVCEQKVSLGFKEDLLRSAFKSA